MRRTVDLAPVTTELSVEKFASEILAHDLGLSEDQLESLRNCLIEALAIAEKTCTTDDFVEGFEAAYADESPTIAPSQIALYLPESTSIPELNIDPGLVQKAIQKHIEHDSSYYRLKVGRELTPKPGEKQVAVDLARFIVFITRNALGCYFSNSANAEPNQLHYVPPTSIVSPKDVQKIESETKKALAKYLVNKELGDIFPSLFLK